MTYLPLCRPSIGEEETEAVTDVLRFGWLTMGENTLEFERLLANYVGTKYAIVVNSGTSALHSALLACGIGWGDEVIIPSFSFIATANAPLFVGAKPVFADIEGETCGLNPDDVEERITPDTRAIIPVHYGGSPCFIHELREVANKHSLLLIEDACESLGASANGKKVGTFGKCAVFSFCVNKVITTGEGGAVVTDSQEIYEKLKLIRSHGGIDHNGLGYNFRMPEVISAMGIAQLKKIDNLIEMRRGNAKMLSSKLVGIDSIEVPQSPNGFFHIYQLYTIRVKGGRERRDALSAYLDKRGIKSKVYFQPIHLTDFYKNRLGYNTELPITEEISGQVLTLPMYPALTEVEIDCIADAIGDFFR